MRTYKNRLAHAAFAVALVCFFVLSVLRAAPLAAQTVSPQAPVSPKAPVPPSVTPPTVEPPSAPQLTPYTDMNKMPSVPQNAPPLKPQAPRRPSVQPPASPNAASSTSPPSLPGIQSPAAAQNNSSAFPSASGTTLPNSGIPNAAALNTLDIGAMSSLLGAQNPFSGQILGATGQLPNINLGRAGQNETAVLLRAILEKLDALQKTVEAKNGTSLPTKTAAQTEKDSSAQNTEQKTAANNIKTAKNGSILRFAAGKYNILPSCTAVFISQPEADGSFLLTGDRTYRGTDKIYNETFYMLFKAGASGIFDVAFTLSQSEKNPHSFLYALTGNAFLQAVRTGNLVTMRTQTESLTIDLLLDIDFNAREETR